MLMNPLLKILQEGAHTILEIIGRCIVLRVMERHNGWDIHGIRIVQCISIATQRVAKHTPATHMHAAIGLLLLGNGEVNMPSQR
jgi:hypothetical protein